MGEVTRAARVGRMIKDSREQVGVTQVELARRLRVTPPYINNVERGIRTVSLRQLDRIASAIPATVHLTIEISPSCIGGDPACPCQDGDLCHYQGEDAWSIPAPTEPDEAEIAALAEVLNNLPNKFFTEDTRHDEHKFLAGCVLCKGDATAIARAVLAAGWKRETP